MKQLLNVLRSFSSTARQLGSRLTDDRGGEVLEFALITGLMVVGAIGAITFIGAKITARWGTVRDSM